MVVGGPGSSHGGDDDLTRTSGGPEALKDPHGTHIGGSEAGP